MGARLIRDLLEKRAHKRALGQPTYRETIGLVLVNLLYLAVFFGLLYAAFSFSWKVGLFFIGLFTVVGIIFWSTGEYDE